MVYFIWIEEDQNMITFELLEHKDGVYIYSFSSDLDPSAKGIVAIYENGNREVIKQSAIDVKQYYAGHALWGIPIGEKSGTVAWC